MSKTDECQTKAAQCDELATRAKIVQDRERWLRMAEFWRSKSEVAVPETTAPGQIVKV